MTNEWYTQSRAVSNDVLPEFPTEIYAVHDGEELMDFGFDVDNVKPYVKNELGGEAEFATFVKDAGISEMEGTGSAYYNDFWDSMYVIVDIETGKNHGAVPSYSKANSIAVDEGENVRFCRYVRHDCTGFRPAADDEPTPEDQLGWYNIHGDRYKPEARMALDALREYREEHPRKTTIEQ